VGEEDFFDKGSDGTIGPASGDGLLMSDGRDTKQPTGNNNGDGEITTKGDN